MPSNPSLSPALSAPTYDLLGVEMSILTLPEAVRRVLAAVEVGKKGYVCVTGMHGIMEARDDAKLQRILNNAFLCTPDGMPTVWLGQAKGHAIERVYGPDFTLAVLQATQNQPVRHFFFGGADGVAAELKSKMEARFPGLQVVGTYCPPFRPLNQIEREELRALVENARADILWVGLSTPKQERFMAEYLSELPVKVMIGVGAAFDFHTGRARQAPRWMMRAGLEWFFRLVTEPRRLWRRYLLQVPRFSSLVFLDFLGLVSHSSESPEMPPTFRLVGIGYTLFPVLAVLWAMSFFLTTFHSGLAVAVPVAGWSLLAMLSAGVSFFLLHMQTTEDRLDRLVPMATLILSIWSLAVALGAGLAIPFAVVFLGDPVAVEIARFAALLTAIPLSTAIGALALCCLVAVKSSVQPPIASCQAGRNVSAPDQPISQPPRS